MITENEAQELMNKLTKLKNEYKKTNDKKIKRELEKHENICVEKFRYLVTMRTGKYKKFSNYDDLNQEGFEALVKGMKNYDPKKGSAFWWFHKYIDTRISRSANLHTTIRYPLKVARDNTPHKETEMPILIEENYCPDLQIESEELNLLLNNALSKLQEQDKKIVSMAFGLDGNKAVSINKICKDLQISRSVIIKSINNSIATLKNNIRL